MVSATKRYRLFFLIFIFIFAYGCGEKEPVVSADASVISGDIISKLNMQDMVELQKDQIPNYYAFDITVLEDYSVFISRKNGVADEVAIFKAENEESAETVKLAVDERVNQKFNSFKDLNKNELQKVTDSIDDRFGSYVILIISPDSESASDILLSYCK